MRPQTAAAATGTDIQRGTPNISMPEATPANSEKVVATLPMSSANIAKRREADAEAFTDQRRKPLAGNNAHARCRGLHHDKQNAHDGE